MKVYVSVGLGVVGGVGAGVGRGVDDEVDTGIGVCFRIGVDNGDCRGVDGKIRM